MQHTNMSLSLIRPSEGDLPSAFSVAYYKQISNLLRILAFLLTHSDTISEMTKLWMGVNGTIM
jgi:hypothetical protein